MNKLIEKWKEFKEVKKVCTCEPLPEGYISMHDDCPLSPVIKTDMGAFLDWLSKP